MENENSKSVNSSPGNSVMAQLLASQSAKFNPFHKGDKVKGTITKLARSEILVDIGGKSEAIVLEMDKRLLSALMSLLSVGDTVTVSILNPESDTGNPVVSLRGFLEDDAWKKLTEVFVSGEQIECTVTELTKGGYILSIPFGLSGFLPHSHTQANTQASIGKKLQVSVIDLQRSDKKIILSTKKLLTKDEFAVLRKQFPIGQKASATITNVTTFGMFVTLGQGLDGFVHASEIEWEKPVDPTKMFTTGQVIDVSVLGFDEEAKRMLLSIKRLSQDPFAQAAKRFTIDQKIQGAVKKIVKGNVYVYLEENMEGIIPKEKIPPTLVYAIGDTVSATVSAIDTKKRHIMLTPVLKEKPIGYR